MSLLARILCPIDFDERSGRAMAWAEDLATRHGAELRLLHVLPARAESILMPDAGAGPQMDRAAGSHVEALAAMIREHGVRCEAAVVHGDPAFQILQAARDGEADVIVMATHGRKGVSRVVLGSVTAAVLNATPCPLLTIPPGASGTGKAFHHVLCAVDFSPSSAATFSHALAMVEAGHGEVTLLNVVDPACTSGSAEEVSAEAEQSLARLHERASGPAAQWCVLRDAVRAGDPAAEVVKAAAEEGADLIVVGAHSKSAIVAMVGSNAERIVRDARCPVLAVPAPAAAVGAPVLQPLYA
jgi:nucleotide-binding universal stress UspA family protein